MSDQLFRNKNKKTEEFKIKEETQNKRQISSAPQPGFKENELPDVSDEVAKIKADFKVTGVLNIPSNIAMDRLKKIEEGKDVVVDTRYLKQTTDYQEVSKDEKLTDLQREFSEERYKRKKFFGGYKEDSAEMAEVKTRLAEMVDYLNEPVQIGLMADAAQILSNLYRELIRSCNDYLKGHGSKGIFTSTGTLRRQMVERILSSASKESALIVSIAKNTEESIKSEDIQTKKGKRGEFVDGMTWENMLFECRARHYSKEKGDDIGVVGGGTSTIYVVKKENKNFFFKDKEDVKEDTVESKEKAALDNVAMQKSIGRISGEDATWVEEKIKKIGLSFKKDVEEGMDESDARYLMESFRYFEKIYTDAKSDRQGIGLKLNIKYAFESYIKRVNKNYKLLFVDEDYRSSSILADIRSLFNEVLKDESKLSAIKIGFGALAKEYLSAYVLKEAVKLPKGASITNNNVATSRVADLLGIPDVVCKSETTVLNVEGKTKIGNLMEGAEGGYIDDIKPSEQATTYSGKAKKQLLSLSVLDYIMGQIDRHDENYYVTHEKRENRMVITGIKGIDNDACCGMTRPEEIEKIKGNWAALRRITEGKTFNLPAIDYNFAKSIMALSPEVLKYELADLLQPEQISAMIERLTFVQSKVGKVIDLYEKGTKKDDINVQYKIKILETDDEWESLGSTSEESIRLRKYNYNLFRPGLELSTKAGKKG